MAAKKRDRFPDRVVLGEGYPLVRARSVSLHECGEHGSKSDVPLWRQMDCCTEKAAGRRWRLVLERVEESR